MTTKKKNNPTTFINNMKLPIHRWFRYSAGYSSEWVECIVNKKINEKNLDRGSIKVLDPFLGSGTTALACEKIGIKSYGFESHPLIFRIADAKLQWDVNINQFIAMANEIIEKAKNILGNTEGYPELIYKCYTLDNIERLDSIKQMINQLDTETKEGKLCWLAFVSILRSSSHAGTAQWQYVLPNKTKVNVSDPYEAYTRQVELMAEDIREVQSMVPVNQIEIKAELYKHDCRILSNKIEKDSIDLVVTSPPYANNYDYADATRLELSFLGEIKGWSDLKDYVRPHLLRACTQHVSDLRKDTFMMIKDDILKVIYDELLVVCTTLDEERHNHGGKKNYHTMIATYFLDIANVLKNLRYYCKDGANICFVIGDSAPYGIYVPVDKWIGDLSLSLGFKEYEFIKTRDRNTKWKNRKHDVLLKEGFLWIRG
ncbi:DNA modification methylase [Clostridioides sp. ES-S-0049-02]|uniref:DNA methyltransferase n=1 Tax=Clostridioides sp. ES-S-0049-02 TaxID=2770778 RepID=UPI001D1201AD|nr:DNA modification methylase [Clostridioides sp. ES-S-0049-02]